MAFAITKSCCTDASCVSVCPVGCIHPAPGEPGFGTSEILHIDPRACIDCGACADACPVSAIFPVDKLSDVDKVYAQINADYRLPDEPAGVDRGPRYPHLPRLPDGLHVAVVGSGPAGMYTVRELLSRTDATITVLDALPTPGGLIRSGVAVDHPETKAVGRLVELALRHPRVRFVGGVRLGQDVSLAELRTAFDAVFLATGARTPRRLGVPGEDLPRVVSALDVVRWVGGEPGADTSPLIEEADGSTPPRAVIVGTGNVALDLVRLFTLPGETLARTDIADRALRVLQTGPLRDIVVLGRGSSADAAYTTAEYQALTQVPGLEIRVVEAEASIEALDLSAPDHPRVTFVFGSAVRRFDDGGGSVRITVDRVRAGEQLTWEAQLVITSIGHLVEAVEGLTGPDGARPRHVAGRVTDCPGVYVVGWAKRGAVGGIGANRQCAAESVDSFVDSFADADEPAHRAVGTPAALLRRLRRDGVRIVDARGSTRIDAVESRAGEAAGRPRIKLTDLEALHRAARRRIGAR